MAKVLRVNKHALFDLVGYQPHEGQWRVHNSSAPRRVLSAGVRWGKSLCAAMEGLAAAMAPAKSSIGWVCAPNYQLAERIFGEIEQRVLAHLKHRVIEYKPSERLIVLRNLGGGTSEIRTKSADNPVSLLGSGIDWVVVDECARLKREIWHTHLSQRLLDKHGWGLLISSPVGTNWFYRLYRKGIRRVEGFEAWSAPSFENPMLDREAIERERAVIGHENYAQEYLGEFIGASLEACELCAGPSAAIPGFVVAKRDRPLPTCAECEQAVDDSGRSVVGRTTHGVPLLKRVLLPNDDQAGVYIQDVVAYLDGLTPELLASASVPDHT